MKQLKFSKITLALAVVWLSSVQEALKGQDVPTTSILATCPNGVKFSLEGKYLGSCQSSNNYTPGAADFYQFKLVVENITGQSASCGAYNYFFNGSVFPSNYNNCNYSSNAGKSTSVNSPGFTLAAYERREVGVFSLGFLSLREADELIENAKVNSRSFCTSAGTNGALSQNMAINGYQSKEQNYANAKVKADGLYKQGKRSEAMKVWDDYEKRHPEDADKAKSERIKINSQGNLADQKVRDKVEQKERDELFVIMLTAGVFMYKGIGHDKEKNVFLKNSWRFNFTCGYSFAITPVYVNDDTQIYTGSAYKDSYTVTKGSAPTFNLDLGLQYWPYYGKNGGIGIIADSFGGYLPLSGTNAAYLYEYGGQAYVGFPGFQITGSYLMGYKGAYKYWVFSSTYGKSIDRAEGAAKFSRLMVGPRFTFKTSNSIGNLEIQYVKETYPNMATITTGGVNISYYSHNRIKIYGEYLFQSARIGTILTDNTYTLSSEVTHSGQYIRFGVIRTIDFFGGH